MKVVDIPLEQLREAPWNANILDEGMEDKLRTSIRRYGFVQNLVVRPVNGAYEVISGNQRLKILADAGVTTVPCVVVEVDDAHARLLAEAMNRVHGEDDLGLRAELVREVLEQLPEEEVLSLLPETAESLKAIASLGQEDIAGYLDAWTRAQAARLRQLQFQLTPGQLEVIEEALQRVVPMAKEERGGSPNVKGTALFLLCKRFLEEDGS